MNRRTGAVALRLVPEPEHGHHGPELTLLEQWELLDLLYAVDGKYYFTAKGKYYYRQMDRVLLTAVEYALYGKPGLMEQAGQKMMGIMKNMK